MWRSYRLNSSSLKPYWRFRSPECFSNWAAGLAIRSCFTLVPEGYQSLFEEFEFLLYGFSLPILLAKWLHAGTWVSWELRPSQLHLSFPAGSVDRTETRPSSKRWGKLLYYRKDRALDIWRLMFGLGFLLKPMTLGNHWVFVNVRWLICEVWIESQTPELVWQRLWLTSHINYLNAF